MHLFLCVFRISCSLWLVRVFGSSRVMYFCVFRIVSTKHCVVCVYCGLIVCALTVAFVLTNVCACWIETCLCVMRIVFVR